mgnify:CR=1 FL=1
MAVVNVDLSEYDAIRKRNSELEEQVKELKKQNESLKSGSKVILRKEIVVERNVDVPTYDHITGLPTYKQRMCRDVVESSESYVNFEDVRLKVEQAMQDEVNRSINDRNQEKQAYAEMKNKLVNEQVGMDFGKVIEALKSGLSVRRKGWNGKGMFVVKQIPSHIEGGIIPTMQSLPQSAKDILLSRENAHIDYTNQMLFINPDGRADSWVPSSSDVFAEDWEVVITEDGWDSFPNCAVPSASPIED